MPGPRGLRLAAAAAALAFLAAALGGCGSSGDECADWPTDRRPLRLVVIVDATDGLSRPQREDIWSRIRPAAERAPAGSVVHLFEVRSGAPGGFREVGAIPRPPHRCEVDHWNDNPDQRAAQWAPLYLRPIRDALGRMARAAPGDSSAILETVQAAALRFAEDPETDGRLILVSDLIQNTEAANFYRGVPTFLTFRSGSLYREVATRRLAGVALTVLLLPPNRPGAVDEKALRRFWTDYFTTQGMTAVESAFLPVEGPRPAGR